MHSAAPAAAAAKSLQWCPTLCWKTTRLPHPWDSPGKNTGVGCHFLLQCIKVKVKSLSRVRLLATPWTAAYQTPPSMGFSRQEYWSGLPLPSPPGGASGKESACQCSRHKRLRFYPWVRKIPWSRKWQPTPVLLPGKFHGRRSLVGYSPWGH